jgi:hypothetical protein
MGRAIAMPAYHRGGGQPSSKGAPDARLTRRPGPSQAPQPRSEKEPLQDRRVPVTIATTADLVRLARRTRAFVTDPAKHWSIRRDPQRDVLQGVRVHAPDALAYFGAPAVLAAALTTGTVCRWCQAFVRAATARKRLPANEAMLELLGWPCDRCARLIFRQVTDSLEAAMAAPLDAPSPGSVDATRDQESTRLPATGRRRNTPEPSHYQRRRWPVEGGR